MKRVLTVSVVQMQSIPNKIENNLSRAFCLAKEAVRKGAKLIVFPELFDSGYALNGADLAFSNDFKHIKHTKTLKVMQDFAKKYNVFLVGCVIESDEGNLYDSAFIIAPKGLLGIYRKIYLWGEETKRFQRGEQYPVFTLDIGDFCVKVGLQICYEIGFSEGSRILSLKGAQILIYPSAFGMARKYAWDIASKARALENGAFVLAANQSGRSILNFCGTSRIISPKGKVLREARRYNDVLVHTLKLDKVTKQRVQIPYLKDINIPLTQKALQSLDIDSKHRLKSKAHSLRRL